MIGILCSNGNEEVISKKLHTLWKGIIRKNDDNIIVFTILNINFLENTLTGSLISEEEIRVDSVPFPSVIFNFSVQLNSDCIKARKLLEDIENVELVNNVNIFDQSIIMEILSVSEINIKYLLPYYIYDKEIELSNLDEFKRYILIPLKGTSISRVIYKKPQADLDKLIDDNYIKKNHIYGLIKATLFKRRRILIEVPELVTNNENPVILRTYVQKGYGKIWEILGNDIFPNQSISENITFEKTNEVALSVINYINKYMPTLGAGFIDLILSSDGKIYFLHLGGIEEEFLKLKQNDDFYQRFYKNLIKQSSYLNYM